MTRPPNRPIVLLAEDSDDDVFFFRYTLKKTGLGCTLFTAADGRAAREFLAAGLAGDRPWPDLVFLDLKMPTFSGFEILEWLREQQPPRPIDVAVLSGSAHTSDIERARSLGATDYFVKPIAIEQLHERLKRAGAVALDAAPPRPSCAATPQP